MNCMANGLGSRRANAAQKSIQVATKRDEGTSSDSLGVEKDPAVLDAKPLSEVYVAAEDADFGNQIPRLKLN